MALVGLLDPTLSVLWRPERRGWGGGEEGAKIEPQNSNSFLVHMNHKNLPYTLAVVMLLEKVLVVNSIQDLIISTVLLLATCIHLCSLIVAQ